MSVLLPAICIHECANIRCSNSGPICPDHYTDRICKTCQNCSVYHESDYERHNPYPIIENEEGYDSDNSLYESESSISSLYQDEQNINNNDFINYSEDEFENIFNNDFNSDDNESE